MVRNYGWYSNKSRGIQNKQGMKRLGDKQLTDPENNIVRL